MIDPQKDKSKEEEKELKRLLDAHVLVYKNRHGKTPSLEELSEMLSKTDDTEEQKTPTPVASKDVNVGSPVQEVKGEKTTEDVGLKKEDPVAPGPEAQGLEKEDGMHDIPEPKILNMKCYYGMKDIEGKKEPDPNRILFYEHPDIGRTYSVEDQNWMDSRPHVLDHLPSRALNFDERDIVGAIAHGVMDDEDYMTLEKAGMITDTPKRLWELGRKLKTQVADLQSLAKSEEEPNEETEEPEELEEDQPNLEEDYSVAKKMLELATSGSDSEFSEGLLSEGGSPFDNIMKTAMKAAMTGMEKQIREIVREEIENLLNDSEDLEENHIEDYMPEDDFSEYNQENVDSEDDFM